MSLFSGSLAPGIYCMYSPLVVMKSWEAQHNISFPRKMVVLNISIYL